MHFNNDKKWCIEELKNMLESYNNMIEFKLETSYYNSNKRHLSFIEDIIEWHKVLIKMVDKIIETTRNSKKNRKRI